MSFVEISIFTVRLHVMQCNAQYCRCNSVLLSIHLSDVCIVTKRNNRLSISQHQYETGISLVFPFQHGLLEIFAESDPSVRSKM